MAREKTLIEPHAKEGASHDIGGKVHDYGYRRPVEVVVVPQVRLPSDVIVAADSASLNKFLVEAG